MARGLSEDAVAARREAEAAEARAGAEPQPSAAPAAVEEGRRARPCEAGKRDGMGRLTFDAPPTGCADFRPNLSPREMLERGMHGGVYFHPKGGKQGVKYPYAKHPNGIPGVGVEEFPEAWFAGIPERLYRSRTYSVANNMYKVKSGLDQAAWETNGWINAVDPRGWTQWYFRFFEGRRLKGGEDERQISRWRGVCGAKGRWKRNLLNKIVKTAASRGVDPHTLLDDASISPVVRQTLLHWAYEVSAVDLDAHLKEGAPAGPYG